MVPVSRRFSRPGPGPLTSLAPGERRAVLWVVLSGLFTVSVAITVLSNSLDGIAGDLHSTRAAVLWTITGPMLAFGVVGPAFGKLGDLFGHRRVFVGGLAGAALFAALTAVAWSAPTMIAFRILSATCGSATGPATMAYINKMFPPAQRVRPLGYWSFVSAGAPVIGVVIGAPVVSAVGWRVIFFAQAPLCALGALVAWLLLPETERSRGVRFDALGAATLGAGATLMLVAINRGNHWGWGSPVLLATMAAAVVLLSVFVVAERRVAEPLLRLDWLARPGFSAAIAGQTLSNFAYMGSFILVPSLMQNGMGFSETASGMLLIARPATFALAALKAGAVNRRVGERTSAVSGIAMIAAAMVGFALLDAGSAMFFVILALAVTGVGMGVAGPPMVASVANSVDDADLGVAGAFQQLMSQLGAVLGAEVMQSVQLAAGGAGTAMPDFARAFFVAAAVAGLGAFAVSRLRPVPAEQDVALATP